MKKRVLSLGLALLLLFSLAACGQGNGAEKSVTLTVVHGDGTSKDIAVKSAKETLGEALLEAGVISGDDGPYGLFVTTVDGETADDSKEQWWCLTKGGESVNTGVDSTPFADGDTFEFTFTEGF